MNRKPYLLIGDTKGNNMNYDLMDAYDLAELGTLELFIKKFDRKLLNKRNKYGFSLLHEALYGHKWDIAEFLINEGIDINLKDSGGNTALHYLCDTNDITQAITTAKLLLAHGADINIHNQKGSTVLILAILRVQGHENCSFVEFLCQQHPDFTLKNKAGKTALEIAQMVEAIHENCKLSELIRRYL